jgi:hypothetical protein
MRKGFGFHDRHSPFRFNPETLFIGGAIEGAFYDPSNITTLFQDDAGTTPVTAVEQTVGRILDLSGNGNHATQSVLASRPTYRARYNLFTFTEQFNDAAWTKNNASITANATTAPDGTTTADKMIPSTSSVAQQVVQAVTVAAAVHTISVYAKASGYSFVQFNNSQSGSEFANFDVTSGVVGTTGGGATSSIANVGNGWYRCTCTFSAFTAGAVNFRVQVVPSASASRAQAFQGDGTSGIFIWGAQLLSANDVTTTGNAYQRVAAATSYDTSSPVWRPYLAFDGSNDSMLTGSIDFTGTDKMTVWVGLTKLGADTQTAILDRNNSLNPGSNKGVFGFVYGIGSPIRTLDWRATTDSAISGTAQTFAETPNFNSPTTLIATGTVDAAAPSTALRINSTNIMTSTSGLGGGNFSTGAMVLGARSNLGSPFNGRLYGLIVLGAAASDWQVYVTEQWMAGKTGLQF